MPATYGVGAGPDNMCKKCNKRVYEMEKIIADKAIYHKPCFRCVHCHRVLTLGNYAAIDEQPYCKPHFIELFKKKGKYDMGKPKESTAPKKEPVKAAPVEEPRPASPATRVNDSSDEEGEEREEPKKEEPVRYQQMSSVRNMFENVARSNSPQNAAPAPKAKTPSKWDKPKPATPPPRVDTPPSDRDTPPSDGDVTDAPADTQPPAAITRNLVAKFRELEQAEVPVPDRKPVHKITPPRDELAASIAEYEETVAAERTPEPVQEEDPEEEVVMSGEASSPQGELPPAQLTRQMLARFQSLEDVAASPPSPQQRAPSKRSNVERTPSTSRQTRPARASPDSGIVDVELHAHTDAQTNGHADTQTHGHNETNGLDETNGHADGPLEPEQELPEQGFTRSLLAKWRVIEETSPEAAPPQPITRKDSARSTPRREVAAPEPVYNGRESPAPEESPREILRESDTKEEDDLPPPSFTRNMLAKFQNLEAEAERQAAETSQPSRKQSFKWTVRSAPLMSRSGMVWEEKQRHLSSADVDDEQFPDDNDAQVFYDNDDTAEYEDQSEIVQSGAAAVDGESERPPAEFTRNMLAKFQSFEDVNQPPPSPARAEVQQRKAYASSSSGATNARFSSSTVTMATSDGRYDDSASNDDVDLQEYYHHDADLHGDHDEYDRYGNADVTRETDPGENELPEEGMARNLAAKFTSLQSAA